MKKKDLKRLLKSLPKTPNIMGRDNLFNCAVLVPFIKIKGSYYLLLQKRAKHIRQGGDICFPGGGFEKDIDKNFRQTALRETKEELGIKKKNIKIVAKLDTLVAPFGAVVEPFVGIVKKSALRKLKLDYNEVEKTILVPLEHFKNYDVIEYTLRSEVKPYHIDEFGNKEVYFPVQELGLPKMYQEPWGNKKHKVYVYKYQDEVIWGLTAIILRDLLKRY